MIEPVRQIAFEQAGLGSVLKQNRLVVPTNQREYAWKEQQVTQLFQDLASAVNEGTDYFLGTIVTIPRLNGTLEVVDGQQRLATTALLLAAIRDYLQQVDEDYLVESINNEFLTGIDRVERARVPKLRLNIDDNDLFADLITRNSEQPLPTAVHASNERLVSAYERAWAHVKNIVAVAERKTHGDFLERWVSFIEHNALVVLLRVPDDADAYKMFETLNDRGLRTSQVDLIKNYLFGRSGDRIAEVQNRWSYMRGALEALDDEDMPINYLRHALIVMNGYRREADVYETVQENARSAQAAVNLAVHLENLSSTYVATFSSDHEKWNDQPRARNAIEVLNLFNIKPMRPLILAISARFNASETAAALSFAAVLGVRLLIASSTRSGSVEVPLATAANDVFTGKIETTNDLKRSLAQLIPSDQEFRQTFEVARVSNARFARYYLRSLELTAKGEPEPWFIPQTDQTVINLEHVLPRKPQDNWPDWSDDAVRLNATRLGNLVLMRAADNSDLKSDAFAEKRKIYADSPYVLTSQVGDVEEWTPEAIRERQAYLAELAVRTWRA
jgi:hypothetical protein